MHVYDLYTYIHYYYIILHLYVYIYITILTIGHLKRFDESIQYIVKDLVKVAVSLHRDIMSNFRLVHSICIVYSICMGIF